MHHLRQATKSGALVLALLWLVAGCGSPAGQQPVPTPAAPPARAAPTQTVDATPNEAGLTAVLSQVQGDVTVVETGDGGDQTTRVARPMQVLAAGTTLRLLDGARAGLICSTERWIDLAEGSDWQLTEAACAQGRQLPAGTFKSMTPNAGRILSLEGGMVVESQTKEKEADYGRIPVILSPRNTRLLELAPELRWVEVDGAIEYVLSLSGRTGFDAITVDAAELDCVVDALTQPNRICSLPWPATDWPLAAGQRYFLTVAARTGVAADLRLSETSALRTLAGDAADGVKADVTGIQALDLDAVTQDVLLAGVYVRNELYGKTIDAYEQAVSARPAPAIYVALGDVYSQVALYRWAFQAYQSALGLLSQGEDDPALRAAAEFGIGRVYYAYADNYTEAARHFEAAMRLYEAAGAPEWSTAAQRALEEARKRLP